MSGASRLLWGNKVQQLKIAFGPTWRMEEGALKTDRRKRQNLSVSFLDRRLRRGKQHEEKPADRRERK